MTPQPEPAEATPKDALWLLKNHATIHETTVDVYLTRHDWDAIIASLSEAQAPAGAAPIVIKLKFGKFVTRERKDAVWVDTLYEAVITREQWKRLGEPREVEVILPESHPISKSAERATAGSEE